MGFWYRGRAYPTVTLAERLRQGRPQPQVGGPYRKTCCVSSVGVGVAARGLRNTTTALDAAAPHACAYQVPATS
eukprot:360874-Chlamydomonas_euryale.AAC.22